MTTQDARRAADDLRRALPRVALDGREGAARAALAEVEAGLGGPQPDRARVAGGLERLTRLLAAAGALVGAGATFVEPLRALASWLGELGTPLLGLLG